MIDKNKDKELILEGLILLRNKLDKDNETEQYSGNLSMDINYINKLIENIEDRLADWI